MRFLIAGEHADQHTVARRRYVAECIVCAAQHAAYRTRRLVAGGRALLNTFDQALRIGDGSRTQQNQYSAGNPPARWNR